MKTALQKVIMRSLLIACVLCLAQCDRAPTEPKPVKSNESGQIPYESLSGKIVFRRNLSEFPDNYYFISLDAEKKSLSEITYFETYVPSNLAISPDGEDVLFSYFIYKGQANTFLWQLYSLNIPSLVVRNINPSLYDDSYGAWSPDGSQIAFWSNRFSAPSIWLIDFAEDTSYHLVDIKDVNNTRPAWLPNGDNFIYVDVDSSVRPTLFQFSLNSGESVPLYSDEQTASNVSFKHPMVSPNGNYVAFVKAFLDFTEELWIYDLANNRATRLTEGHSDWHPAWSPDGNKILFSRTRNLFLINRDGSGLTQVTFRTDCTDEFPSWVSN